MSGKKAAQAAQQEARELEEQQKLSRMLMSRKDRKMYDQLTKSQQRRQGKVRVPCRVCRPVTDSLEQIDRLRTKRRAYELNKTAP
jgi:hypothetical protein